MWEKRRELIEWLDGGAVFYVCGDAKAMAKDVRATLVRAYADVKSLIARGGRAGGRASSSATSAICRTCTETPQRRQKPMTDDVSRNERIKEASDYLRGTLAEGLRDEITGAIVEDDQQLVKFHGMYLQDDRDLRAERTRKKLEKAFAFMIRVRIPGGVLSPQQWLALDEVARTYGNGTMRLTTRQTIQLHGIIKSNLKATLKEIDDALLNTIAACGDVNRNVMCNPNPVSVAGARRGARRWRRRSPIT